MKIVLSTTGSTGDVEPFIPLAKELTLAGHTVTALSNVQYKEKFENVGAHFSPVGDPLDLERLGDLFKKIEKLNKISQYFHIVDEVILHNGEKHYSDCRNASQGADLAICHTFDVVGQQAIIANGIPWASVIFCPGMIPTIYDGPMEYPNLGKIGNRLLWFTAKKSMFPLDRKVSKFLRNLDGNNRKSSVFGNYSSDLNLVAASKHLGNYHPDLPGNFSITGPWQLEQEQYTPSKDLEQFIDTMKPEVVFTFGSVPGGKTEGENLAKTFIEAAELANVSCIIQKGWSNISLPDYPDSVMFVDYVPHDYLFSKVNLVVHHGGAGTSLAASKAGAASLVVPHWADQKYYAVTMQKLGVSGKDIHRRKLTAKNLAREIRKILNNKTILHDAHLLGEKIRSEPNGARTAVHAIDKIFLTKENNNVHK